MQAKYIWTFVNIIYFFAEHCKNIQIIGTGEADGAYEKTIENCDSRPIFKLKNDLEPEKEHFLFSFEGKWGISKEKCSGKFLIEGPEKQWPDDRAEISWPDNVKLKCLGTYNNNVLSWKYRIF